MWLPLSRRLQEAKDPQTKGNGVTAFKKLLPARTEVPIESRLLSALFTTIRRWLGLENRALEGKVRVFQQIGHHVKTDMWHKSCMNPH